VRPIRRDPRVTRWCFYFWDLHYLKEQCANLPKQVFIQALRAEGVPVGDGAHGKPIYQHPVLRDYPGTIVKDCPTAERVHKEEAVSLPHSIFLGTNDSMDLIIAAFKKVYENAAELVKYAEGK